MFYLLIGPGYFGTGHTLSEAKRRYRAEGGILSKGYAIAEFQDENDYLGVNEVGMVSYRTAPTVTQVPRKNGY